MVQTVNCKRCAGTGFIDLGNTAMACEDCEGAGVIQLAKEVSPSVEAATDAETSSVLFDEIGGEG